MKKLVCKIQTGNPKTGTKSRLLNKLEIMSAEKILNENWSEYDDKKIRDKRDRRYFACDETWEVDYLIKKIKKYFPFHNDTQILNAIKSCCKTVSAPRPRAEFIKCVIGKL